MHHSTSVEQRKSIANGAWGDVAAIQKEWIMGRQNVFGISLVTLLHWIVLGCASIAATAVSASPENLFSQIGTAGPPPEPHDVGAVIAWPVTINLPFLATLPASVMMTLPNRLPATVHRGRFEDRGNHAFLWTGNGDGCAALFSADGTGFRTLLSCSNGTYSVDTIPGSESLQLTYYDPALIPEYDDGPAPGPSLALTPRKSPPVLNASGSDTTVDLLVVYTEAVRQSEDPDGGSAKTKKFIRDMVDRTQQAMDQSTKAGQPSIAQLRIVAAQQVARAEGGFFGDDLVYLRNDPEVAAARDFWAADVVVLVRATSPNSNSCGLANEPGTAGRSAPGPGFAPEAFAVLLKKCAISSFPFQHELAHIFGANHNKENDGNPTPLRPYAYGAWFVDVDAGYRTIMAMNNSGCKPSCSQILNYSNPDVLTEDGLATGGLNRNNAAVIAEFAAATANYRDSLSRLFYSGFED